MECSPTGVTSISGWSSASPLPTTITQGTRVTLSLCLALPVTSSTNLAGDGYICSSKASQAVSRPEQYLERAMAAASHVPSAVEGDWGSYE